MVYFLQMGRGGPIKIGYSRDNETLKRRMAALSSALPYAPRLLGVISPGGRELEAALHIRFKAQHLRGEWYESCPDLVHLANDTSYDVLSVCPESRAMRAADRRWRELKGELDAIEATAG